MNLADAFHPLDIEEFKHTYLGHRYVVVRGTGDRFGGLVTWTRLNDVLSCLRVDDDRVFLVRNAKHLHKDNFTFVRGDHRYIDGSAVGKHLQAGATLSIAQIDELVPEVRRLAESCEEHFRTYVPANLYAAWRSDNGFDVHWDTHDTLIVQVLGRKDWKVWQPTRLHPLPDERHQEQVVPQPTGDPIWEGTLNAGDVLYMPRGWWHIAFPRDEPCMHITFGIKPGTGADLLHWVVRQLRETVELRMDVPALAGVEARTAWVKAMSAACVAQLNDDVVERYVRSREQEARARPVLQLDDRVGQPSEVNRRTAFRLRRGRRLDLTIDDGKLAFRVEGAKWQCHLGLAPALELLNHITPCSMQSMTDVVDSALRPLLPPLMTALTMSDVASAERIDE